MSIEGLYEYAKNIGLEKEQIYVRDLFGNLHPARCLRRTGNFTGKLYIDTTDISNKEELNDKDRDY
ncbi:MAG: hypothetical protein ACI4NM_01790 [Bullifex sp.]